jgi:hypothetical protein
MSKERERLYEQYRQLGMTEDQINAIRLFDDDVEKSDREFYEHMISLEDIR